MYSNDVTDVKCMFLSSFTHAIFYLKKPFWFFCYVSFFFKTPDTCMILIVSICSFPDSFVFFFFGLMTYREMSQMGLALPMTGRVTNNGWIGRWYIKKAQDTTCIYLLIKWKKTSGIVTVLTYRFDKKLQKNLVFSCIAFRLKIIWYKVHLIISCVSKTFPSVWRKKGMAPNIRELEASKYFCNAFVTCKKISNINKERLLRN